MVQVSWWVFLCAALLTFTLFPQEALPLCEITPEGALCEDFNCPPGVQCDPDPPPNGCLTWHSSARCCSSSGIWWCTSHYSGVPTMTVTPSCNGHTGVLTASSSNDVSHTCGNDDSANDIVPIYKAIVKDSSGNVVSEKYSSAACSWTSSDNNGRCGILGASITNPIEITGLADGTYTVEMEYIQYNMFDHDDGTMTKDMTYSATVSGHGAQSSVFKTRAGIVAPTSEVLISCSCGANDGVCPAGCTNDPDCSFCGDGTVNPGEQCDDGNKQNGDTCNQWCQTCGPGNGCPTGCTAAHDPECAGAAHLKVGLNSGAQWATHNAQQHGSTVQNCAALTAPSGTILTDNEVCNLGTNAVSGCMNPAFNAQRIVDSGSYRGYLCAPKENIGGTGSAAFSIQDNPALFRCSAEHAYDSSATDHTQSQFDLPPPGGQFCCIVDGCSHDGTPTGYRFVSGKCSLYCDVLGNLCECAAPQVEEYWCGPSVGIGTPPANDWNGARFSTGTVDVGQYPNAASCDTNTHCVDTTSGTQGQCVARGERFPDIAGVCATVSGGPARCQCDSTNDGQTINTGAGHWCCKNNEFVDPTDSYCGLTSVCAPGTTQDLYTSWRDWSGTPAVEALDESPVCCDQSSQCASGGVCRPLGYRNNLQTAICGRVGSNVAAAYDCYDAKFGQIFSGNTGSTSYCCIDDSDPSNGVGIFTTDLSQCGGSTCSASTSCDDGTDNCCPDTSVCTSDPDCGSIRCNSNADCPVRGECHGFWCQNPGTTNAVCRITWFVSSTPCSSDGNECTRDHCSGISSTCLHTMLPSGTPCAGGTCDGPPPVCVSCDQDNDGYNRTDEAACANPIDCNDLNPSVTGQPETVATCSDGWDNDCNGEADSDGFTGGLVPANEGATLHGDLSCPVEIIDGSAQDITTTVACTSGAVEVRCETTPGDVRSIGATLDGVDCGAGLWQGNEAVFSCPVPTDGTYTAVCTVDTAKSYQMGPDWTDSTVVIDCLKTVTGTVKDATSANPIEDALVRIADVNRETRTDSAGTYAFTDVAVGNHNMTANHDFYVENFKLNEFVSSEPTIIDFDLAPEQCTANCTFRGRCDYSCVDDGDCSLVGVSLSDEVQFRTICGEATHEVWRDFNSSHIANCCAGPIESKAKRVVPLVVNSCTPQFVKISRRFPLNGEQVELVIGSYQKCE